MSDEELEESGDDKLIGMHVDLHTDHPQEFADALYEQVYDHYDPDVEIDVVVAVRVPSETEDQFESFDVVDYRTMRVGEELLYDGAEGTTNSEDFEPFVMLKAYDEWGRSVEGANGYIVAHKHRERNPFPSKKDQISARLLSTIDYARTPMRENGELPRWFMAWLIMNRNVSFPIHASDWPIPTGDREIDLAMIDKMFTRIQVKFGLDDDGPIMNGFYRLRSRMVELFNARDAEDPEAEAAAQKGIHEALEALDPYMQELFAEEGMAPTADLEALRDKLHELGLSDEVIEGLIERMESMQSGETFEIETETGIITVGKFDIVNGDDSEYREFADERRPGHHPKEALFEKTERVYPEKKKEGRRTDPEADDPMASYREALAKARDAKKDSPKEIESLTSHKDEPEARPDIPDVFKIDFGEPPAPPPA